MSEKKLHNMVSMMKDSLSEALFYAGEVESLLKERNNQNKRSCQHKKEKKERKIPQ